MKHSNVCILLAATILLLSSCKETTVTGTGAAGNIVGFIQVMDTLSNAMDDASGVTVSLPGTPYTALSDHTGRWQLSGVPEGTYKILFSKAGYSSFEEFNISFQGNGTFYYKYGVAPVVIFGIPNFHPDLVLRPFEDHLTLRDSDYYDSLGYYHYVQDTIIQKYYSAEFTSKSQYTHPYFSMYLGVVLYFSKTKNIDPMDTRSFLLTSLQLSYDRTYDSTGTGDFTVYRSDLQKSGFSSGDSVYCQAYSGLENILNVSTWTDPETNKIVYGGFGISRSNVRAFLMP
jgi:hypothetical protein